MENQNSSQKEFEELEGKIEKMINTFIKAEKQGKEGTKKYLDWIKGANRNERNRKASQ